jgi:PAS domain S-box-containing protein
VNERFCEIAGRTAAELLTLSSHDITHPDDLVASATRFKSVAMGKTDFSLEKRYLRPDGTIVWVSNSVAWITDGDDVPRGFVEISQDISERKRLEAALQGSETYFRELTQSLPLGVWTSLPDGKADFVNRYWLEYIGHTSDIAMLGPDAWTDALHPDDVARVEEIARAPLVVKHGYSVEARFRRAVGGEYRWFLKRSVPIHGADGVVQKRIGIAIDIDDIKRAQRILADHAGELAAQVHSRTSELRETIGELEAFSYSVSHDMRAPLRAMQGFASLLLKKNETLLDAPSVDQLRRINASANRMDALINDVLTYSRLLRSEITLAPVNLDDLVRQVIDAFPHLQENDAQIDIEGHLPEVLAHEAGLTQCISNLLSNAVKFVAPGVTARVRVRAEEIDGEVCLWIEDNGIGIDPQNHERIWNIFTRVERDRDYTGTGIGLAIVRKAVERMNGKVGLESTLGDGSRFWLRLPKG